MRKLRFLHAADLHLDSPFQALSVGKAAVRRGEQRQLLSRLAALCQTEQVDLVLLSGDLLDSENSYCETGETLCAALEAMAVPVFLSPGNHDFYSPRSPYARLKFPGNVHVFTENRLCMEKIPALPVWVHGAAFTQSQSAPLLENYSVKRENGVYNLLCMHGDFGRPDSVYNPVTEQQLAQSGFHYVALGHIHKASGLLRAGSTWYAWPGCPEGRGFDECGEKTVNLVELEDNACSLRQISIAQRRYEILPVDISGADPLLAIHTALPDDTVRDIYRILLTGETDRAPDLATLSYNLSEFFFSLQLQDETRLQQSLWTQAGEDSLRGIFLAKLKQRYDSCVDDSQRSLIEQAARWGLAALDQGEEVVCHADS